MNLAAGRILCADREKKKRRGYPQDNIIFEDSRTAVLIQNRHEIMRAPVDDTSKLARLLELFFSYERPEIAQFRKAVEQFKTDLPAVLDALRETIEEFGGMSDENVARIERQNKRKISVIIGNPPYNANQQNENDNNKTALIRASMSGSRRPISRESTAQKIKLYDMYARFFRWASDRIKEEGIIAYRSIGLR